MSKKLLKKKTSIVNQVVIDQMEIIRAVSSNISSNLDIDQVLQNSVDLVVDRLGYFGAVIFLTDYNSWVIRSKTLSQTWYTRLALQFIEDPFDKLYVTIDEKSENYIVKTLLTQKNYTSYFLSDFVVPALTQKVSDLLQKVTGHKSGISIPMKFQDEIIGVILFTKKTQDNFDNDIPILQSFADQVAIAINNSQLFSQVQSQLGLLKITNNDLESLTKLTSSISTSLIPQEVMELAVNTIPQNKIIIGAAISMLDHSEKHMVVEAITDNPITRTIAKKTGDITKIQFDVKINTNSYHALKTQQPVFNDDLTENFDGIIHPKLVKFVQRISKISTIAEYPIVSRGKSIGTITYFLKDTKADNLTSDFKQLLTTYTLQISTALQNAIQYQESQVMQRNLQRALNGLHEARRRERDMIDVMGHELRTPLSIVRNALVVLDKDFKQDGIIQADKLEKYLAMAIESARREMSLVETLLAATKLDSHRIQLSLTKCDLIDVVEDSLEALHRTATQKGLVLDFIKPEKDIFVYADRTRIQEVMDNLISNAIKYTKEGSVQISLVKKKAFVTTNIKDTGVGITKEDISKLGKKFFRASQMMNGESTGVHPGGTGLGLYVSFGLVGMMNGKYDIKSEPGKGSTFSFSFPTYTNQKDVEFDQTLEK